MIQWLTAARRTSFILSRKISTCHALYLKANKLPPRPKINEDEIEEVFIKGGGNGGQKINKTNSKVQLKHIPTGIVVSSQFSRSREDNRKRARQILALKVEELTVPAGQSRNEIVGEYRKKKAKNRKKKSKRKYRKLEEEKERERLAEREKGGGVKGVESDGIENEGVENEGIEDHLKNDKLENEQKENDQLKSDEKENEQTKNDEAETR